MTENNRTSHTDAQAGTHAEPQVDPTLRGLLEQPKGVLQKNLKTFVYLSAGAILGHITPRPRRDAAEEN